MKKRNHIKKISDYAMVGGLGAVLVTGLVGCSDGGNNNQQQQQSAAFSNAAQKEGAFVVIEQSPDGRYAIADEFPASKTTIVLRNTADGSERILTQAEIDALVKEEEKKIDAGTSALTNPDQAQLTDGGMGLGGVLLSSIAGAMIGSWLGNKLFNNQNYQNQRKAQYKNPQTYSRSQSSFSKNAKSSTSKSSSSSKKSGFFGKSSGSSSSKSSFGG